MSFSYRDETKELNDLTRKEASGSFIQLSDGVTHYELSNPEAEKTVVLAHGFSVPYFIYDPTFEFLTQSGFRVVRYDLFGRGFSDRPETRYNIDLFVRQLGDLLDTLGFTQPVSLVGLSTGGPITTVFTARHPERVNKLVLIDPIGANRLPFARILKLATLPIVGETVMGWIGIDGMYKIIASDFLDRRLVEEFQPRYILQMRYKGFKRAILSTIRNRMLDSFLDDYQRVAKLGKPVLLFWGRNDPTVPFRHSDTLRTAIPTVEFHAIENCGHIPHYEKPEEVNPILLEFLRK
jgi:Predicted hydrolases or acyltransferases (alpha/beta hydrolase superfamily)